MFSVDICNVSLTRTLRSTTNRTDRAIWDISATDAIYRLSDGVTSQSEIWMDGHKASEVSSDKYRNGRQYKEFRPCHSGEEDSCLSSLFIHQSSRVPAASALPGSELLTVRLWSRVVRERPP